MARCCCSPHPGTSPERSPDHSAAEGLPWYMPYRVGPRSLSPRGNHHRVPSPCSRPRRFLSRGFWFWCDRMWYVAIPEGAEAVLAAKFAVMRPLLSERQWRVDLGTEARALGRGGMAAVARAAGCSESTVAAGVSQVEEGEAEVLPPGRSRRQGGGRKKAEVKDPGLRPALAELAEAATRGDPVAEITWCSLSLRDLERQLAVRGMRCGKDAVARMLREDGYSLQGMSRTAEGKQHPDRDAQFGHINDMITRFRAAGEPVVSVDAKKKEQLGPYHRAGRSWRPT